jgi:hypothetical protein
VEIFIFSVFAGTLLAERDLAKIIRRAPSDSDGAWLEDRRPRGIDAVTGRDRERRFRPAGTKKAPAVHTGWSLPDRHFRKLRRRH